MTRGPRRRLLVSDRVRRGAPGQSRTGDLSLRRRLLYPLSYWGGAVAPARSTAASGSGDGSGRPAPVSPGRVAPGGWVHDFGSLYQSASWTATWGSVTEGRGSRRRAPTPDVPEGRSRGLPGQAPQHRQAPGDPRCRHLLSAGAGRAGGDRGPHLPPPRGQHHRVAGFDNILADRPGGGRSRAPRSRSTSSSSAPTAARARSTCSARPPGLSDTTILLHLSADRSRAYGVSIPRDLMVPRPACKSRSPAAPSRRSRSCSGTTPSPSAARRARWRSSRRCPTCASTTS